MKLIVEVFSCAESCWTFVILVSGYLLHWLLIEMHTTSCSKELKVGENGLNTMLHTILFKNIHSPYCRGNATTTKTLLYKVCL